MKGLLSMHIFISRLGVLSNHAGGEIFLLMSQVHRMVDRNLTCFLTLVAWSSQGLATLPEIILIIKGHLTPEVQGTYFVYRESMFSSLFPRSYTGSPRKNATRTRFDGIS